MNDSERTNHRFQNFRTPLILTPSLSTTDNPAPHTPPPKSRIMALDLTQGRAVSEKFPDDTKPVGNTLENQGQPAVDQWKSFQRFSRLKLEQMFPTNPKPTDDQPGTPGTLKLKSETTRSLSRERAENKSTMNQKLINIEERLKKLNGFLMNEFEEKKKYFKELRLPQALTAEAREKIFSFLKQEPTRTEGNPPEERKSEEPAPGEEQKEGSSENVSDSRGQTRASVEDNSEVIGNNTRQERISSIDVTHQPQTETRTEVNGPMDSPLHGRPSINLGGNIDVGINGEYATGNENAANAGEMPIDNNLQSMASREAHFRLRKALITFLSVCLTSTFLLLMYENQFSHRAVFMVMYGFFLYFFIEGCKKAFANEGIQWKRVENIFNIIDVTSSLFFLAVVDLRISGLISMTSFVTVMPGLSCTLYYFCSKAPKSVVESQAMTRTLFAIQIFLITAKIDGTFEWPWKTVLCLMWGYLAMMVLYFILLTFMMILMVVLSIFKISLYQNMDTKTQIIGFFWYLCYVGMGPLLFVVMIGVCEAFDHKQDLTFLGDCLTFAKYYSIAIIMLTYFTYNILIMFLQKFNIDEPEFRIQFGSTDNKTLTKIEVEKRDIYLVMMSSTYFLPLKQSFFVKSKENLKRVKRAIVSTRNRGRKAIAAAGAAVKKRVKTKSEEPVNIETLKKSKDELNKKLKINAKKGADSSKDTKKKPEPRGILREKSCNDMILLPFEREMSKGIDMNKSTNALKYKGECLSEGDKDYLANWEALNELEGGQKQQKDNENLCYVCFDRAPNAVILKCGHGGVCYECAIQFAKEKNQCMECRGAIENVVKINPTPKMRNIIKGYETTKLIAVNPEDE